MIKALVDSGKDLGVNHASSFTKKRALTQLVVKGRAEALSTLLEADGLDVEAGYPLHTAVMFPFPKYQEVIEVLLNHPKTKDQVELENEDGERPMDVAVSVCNYPGFSLLVKAAKGE